MYSVQCNVQCTMQCTVYNGNTNGYGHYTWKWSCSQGHGGSRGSRLVKNYNMEYIQLGPSSGDGKRGDRWCIRPTLRRWCMVAVFMMGVWETNIEGIVGLKLWVPH